jgi:hypothetical protein
LRVPLGSAAADLDGQGSRPAAHFGEENVLARMQHAAPEAAIRDHLPRFRAGPRATPGSQAETHNGVEAGAPQPHHHHPFATETRSFQDAGIATVVCGGSIDQAHQPVEYIHWPPSMPVRFHAPPGGDAQPVNG